MTKTKLTGIMVGIQLLVVAIFMVNVLFLGGCTDAPKATNLLQQQGYSQVEITGYRFFGCGEQDAWHTGFVATAPNGQRVEGVVCEGVFKGQTIRFD